MPHSLLPSVTARTVPTGPSLADVLTARPSGLCETECWAILCQAVQSLQDLFLSDGAFSDSLMPLITPATLHLSCKGRVQLCQQTCDGISRTFFAFHPPFGHLAGYLAPEYRPNQSWTDTEIEKMWIYALGETLKRATLTSHAATLRLTRELCQVLTDMTKLQSTSRASLMHLLDIISMYCRNRQQNRPFSHIVMDLYQEAMMAYDMLGPSSMPELVSRTTLTRSETRLERLDLTYRQSPEGGNIRMPSPNQKITKEVGTSMESSTSPPPQLSSLPSLNTSNNNKYIKRAGRFRRNPVTRSASALCKTGDETLATTRHDYVGPEFVSRALLAPKKLILKDATTSGSNKITSTITVILLNGQKIETTCVANTTTAGQLFEAIIQHEHIEDNFMLGLSALIAGDFVFLPAETKIAKITKISLPPVLTLFLRIRFFLPSMRGVRNIQARHLLYLQLRRSVLEHQLPCNYQQLIELNGLALQAEFGDYNSKEHGVGDYIQLKHYVPETMYSAINDPDRLRYELIEAHVSKLGVNCTKAEEHFIQIAQTLPHYGGHFYTAIWMLKNHNSQKEVWLYICPTGINVYDRGRSTNSGPQLYESFEWHAIQTICYSKHYLCILPHNPNRNKSNSNKSNGCSVKLKKYKLKMDYKKSYFAFRLASLHHQFFLRLKREYTTIQTLSQQFGIILSTDVKQSSTTKSSSDTPAQPKKQSVSRDTLLMTNDNNIDYMGGAVHAETELKIEFRLLSSRLHHTDNNNKSNDKSYKCRRSMSIQDVTATNCVQNKENTNDFLGSLTAAPARRGVKMGTKAFSRVCRSMEAVHNSHASNDVEYLEAMSLQSVSLNSNSTSPTTPSAAPYILDVQHGDCLMPDLQESLNATLMERFNDISYVDERILMRVTLRTASAGDLGLQITEGSDGHVYIQSVVAGSTAARQLADGQIQCGDQVIAVNGTNLLALNYQSALHILKVSTGASAGDVQLLLARRQFPVTDNNHITNVNNVATTSPTTVQLPYHKRIRYEIESDGPMMVGQNRPVVVDAIRKQQQSVALPRSLGLSRKWRGPVRYPVTPLRNCNCCALGDDSINHSNCNTDNINDNECDHLLTTSDEEQVFI